MMQLTPHFHLTEFTVSREAAILGLDNTPDDAALRNLQRLAQVLEVVRNELGGRHIIITSGYRSHPVNQAVRGARGSQHKTGQAADFICPGYGTPEQICLAIIAAGIEFDQLILEPGWVHLSIAETPRGEILTGLPGGRFARGLKRTDTGHA